MSNELFKHIKKDHQELKEFLTQIEGLKESNSQKREHLFMQMKEELVLHMKAEEKVFYSVLLEDEKSKEDTMKGMEEHHASDLVLKELSKMSPEEEYWPAKLSVFKEMLEHHIEEEESTIFEVAEKVIDEKQLNTIGEKFEQEKEKIKDKVAHESGSR